MPVVTPEIGLDATKDVAPDFALVRWLFAVGLFVASLALGWFLPTLPVPKSWRIPPGAVLMEAGIAFAMLAGGRPHKPGRK